MKKIIEFMKKPMMDIKFKIWSAFRGISWRTRSHKNMKGKTRLIDLPEEASQCAFNDNVNQII